MNFDIPSHNTAIWSTDCYKIGRSDSRCHTVKYTHLEQIQKKKMKTTLVPQNIYEQEKR